MKFKKLLLIGIPETAQEDKHWDKIRKLAEKIIFLDKESPQIRKDLPNTDGVCLAFGVPFTKEDIDATPDLKYIGILATAFGKIDVDYAVKKKIPVCNLAGYSTEAVAEFTLAAILEHARQLEEGKVRGRSGNYSEAGMTAREIKGKIFGVIGLGNIGSRVAELAQGFGADVRYWSRHRKKDFEKRGIKYQDADSLLSQADFISINLAQTKDTEGFLNKKRINSLKRGAVVINTAPMELVDINGLVERLKKNDITFILDHADETDPEDMKKMSKHKNCIIYPPIAYITNEARVIKQEMFVSNIENFLKGSPTNKVN